MISDLDPQLLEAASNEQRENLGVTTPDYYSYLNQSGTYTVEDVNDKKEFCDTMVSKSCCPPVASCNTAHNPHIFVCQKAMSVVGLSLDEQDSVLQLVAGILHLGNISFREENNYAVVESQDCETQHNHSSCQHVYSIANQLTA